MITLNSGIQNNANNRLEHPFLISYVHLKECLKLIDHIDDTLLSVTLLLVKVVFFLYKTSLIVQFALRLPSMPDLSNYQVSINGVDQFLHVTESE